MSGDKIDYETLWRAVTKQFLLGEFSVHGPSHWRRVEEIGLTLAESSGADKTIVRLFGVFHDACRWDDNFDPEHGRRGAKLAAEMTGRYFTLDSARSAILKEACDFHADGKTSMDPTIGTCWDADRLDLPRVGIRPAPHMLSTEIAKRRETIVWALNMKRI